MELINTRTIKVWQISSKNAITIETTATNFGQVRQQLASHFTAELLDYENSRFIEGNSRLTFDNDLALLPETVKTKEGTSTTELNILILPKKKTKSGAYSRAVFYSQIKEWKRTYPKAKEFFGNYQNLTTHALYLLIKKFEKQLAKEAKVTAPTLQPLKPEIIKPEPATIDALTKADITTGVDLILKGVKQILSTGLLKSTKQTEFSFEDVSKLLDELD